MRGEVPWKMRRSTGLCGQYSKIGDGLKKGQGSFLEHHAILFYKSKLIGFRLFNQYEVVVLLVSENLKRGFRERIRKEGGGFPPFDP